MKTALRILFAAGCFAVATLISAAGQAQDAVDAPSHMLASVRMLNGGWACSATVIGPGLDKWAPAIGCSHCFKGTINGQFTINYPDGTSSIGVLRRIDRKRELALVFVPSKSVIEYSMVPRTLPAVAKFHVCGYPRTEGPKFYAIRPAQDSVTRINNGMERWKFVTKDGAVLWSNEKLLDQRGAQIIGGNSGCGIFANGQLCSVLSHNGADKQGEPSPILFGCPHSEVVKFLKECADEQQYCGEWFAEPASPQQTAPPPPPDFSDAPPPPGWKPSPNIPIRDHGEAVPPPENPKAPVPPPLYDGKGRPPKDYRHARERSKHIIQDEHTLSEMQQREAAMAAEIERLKAEHDAEVSRLNAELENTKSIAKQPGPPGRDGRDGKDLNPPPPPAVVVKPKPKHGPMHAILLGGLVLFGVIVVDQVHRTRKAAV